MTKNRVRLSGGADWQTDFRRRTTGRAPRSAMEIATVRRMLNHTLTELKRAIGRHSVAAAAADLAPPWPGSRRQRHRPARPGSSGRSCSPTRRSSGPAGGRRRSGSRRHPPRHQSHHALAEPPLPRPGRRVPTGWKSRSRSGPRNSRTGRRTRPRARGGSARPAPCSSGDRTPSRPAQPALLDTARLYEIDRTAAAAGGGSEGRRHHQLAPDPQAPARPAPAPPRRRVRDSVAGERRPTRRRTAPSRPRHHRQPARTRLPSSPNNSACPAARTPHSSRRHGATRS